ncbi:CHAT domain-containing protein [Actinoplanes sp. NPDC048791]|uniref:CHAT domain-containing protein n=1 Tax=Actinoplanes sp. NPDC048791 TaxID=3154623 RepID=UPI0034089550
MRLEVLDFAGPTRWRWRLTDADGGRFLADHVVELDAREWQYEAFTALDEYLLWHAAPDRRLAGEAQLTAQVGAWIGEQVLGPVGPALVKARQPVRLEVPAAAEVLAYRPWELAAVNGRPLAMQRVTVVIDQVGGEVSDKVPVGERLRMLAVFSLPEDASALNLRRERYALAQLVQEFAAANGRAVELRVLQYGATRARLEDVLLEEPGWDVLHISGHGLPAGLLLEDDAGRRDLVSSAELVDLLDLTGEQLKLVTLSTCESAAVTAAEHLRLLGLRPPAAGNGAGGQGTDGAASGVGSEQSEGSLPAVATELVRRLDCAVLAMRFPVVDDFAIALAGSFYGLVLGKGQPVARALGLTMPRVVQDPPTAGAPALSVTTPALFGARAADLRLDAPPGQPVVFQAEQQKLARFDPQPARFVGRVGPMTRATAVLAPRSGRSGVLFHGMAGAGKTACALELAYTHEDGFARLVWHQAPPEGHDITAALTGFALDLEGQLPGIRLAHLVDDVTALRGFLPALTEFLERQRVLLVLDNLESLLTDTGGWRDQRWQLLIDALTGHGGLSRVVLTSRRRIASLPAGVLVEPVHALSLTEAVLLAREWPHLRALLDGASSGSGLDERQTRALAARTLAVVQGHPKLIELADGQAKDPAALQARLEEADQTWLDTGTRLDAFLHHGQASATGEDYLRVLDGWTRGTTSTLPDGSATLFGLLCCLEQDDRMGLVVEDNWADLWKRLGKPGPTPDVEAALAPLLEQALVAVDRNPDTGRPLRFHLHPGVAEAGRTTAGPDLGTAVDIELAAYWLILLNAAREREGEELGSLVRRAALAAAPYLIRQRQWQQVLYPIETLLFRDQSPGTAAAVLPLLDKAREGGRGTDVELEAGRLHAQAMAYIRPHDAATEMRHLLDTAVIRQDFPTASLVASDLLNHHRRRGRFDEALSLAEDKKEYTRRAGWGPWTQLGDEGRRLQILTMQGNAEQVLASVEQLRPAMAALPDSSDMPEATAPWNVREAIFDLGREAARRLGRWERALDLNAEQLASLRGRGASDADQAFSAFNDYGPLLRLGRVGEARTLLQRCRTVFAADHNVTALGKVLSALADLEDELGHGGPAIELCKDALRLGYTADDPDGIQVSHANLAIYLNRYGGEQQQVWAHRLATAVIDYQTGDGDLTQDVRALTRLLTRDEAPPPTAFADVCRIVDQVDGVHLADLVARLPARAPDGQAAMDEVLRQARTLSSEEVLELQRHLTWWEPVIAALVAADRGDSDAAAVVEQVFTTRGEQSDWRRLVAVLRRISAGDHTPALDGLDPIDTAVVRRLLDALAGTVAIDLNAWHTLTNPNDQENALTGFIEATVLAAGGDPDARAQLAPVLDDLAADPQGATFAAVLRHILAGDRDPTLLDELDPATAAVVTVILDRLTAPIAPPLADPPTPPATPEDT